MRKPALIEESPDTVSFVLTVAKRDLSITAPAPELLSQRNVEQATGIPARAYLRMLRARNFGLRVTHEGKLRIVDRAAFVELLRSRGSIASDSGIVAVPVKDAGSILVSAGFVRREAKP